MAGRKQGTIDSVKLTRGKGGTSPSAAAAPPSKGDNIPRPSATPFKEGLNEQYGIGASLLGEFRMISYDLLFPNGWNKRVFLKDDRKDEEIVELARSIWLAGRNVQPVLVRPGTGEKFGHYEIVFGERRWRAVRLLAMGGVDVTAFRKEHPDAGPVPRLVMCEVRKLSDEDAFALTVAENKRRKNLSPFEEAATLEAGLKLRPNWSVPDMASMLGVSQWTARRRMQLLRLTPGWKASIDDPDSDFVHFSARMLETVACLPAEVQDAVLEKWTDTWCPQDYEDMCNSLGQEFAVVDGFPWRKDCGGCVRCSSAQPELWDTDDLVALGNGNSVKKGGICFDEECRDQKAAVWIAEKVRDLKAQGHVEVLVFPDGGDARIKNCGGKIVRRWECETVGKDMPGAKPSIDSRTLQVGWHMSQIAARAAEGKKKGILSTEERLESVRLARLSWCMRWFARELRNNPKEMCLRLTAEEVAAFGIVAFSTRFTAWQCTDNDFIGKVCELACGEFEQLMELFFRFSAARWAERAETAGEKIGDKWCWTADQVERELGELERLFGVDAAELYGKAMEAIPNDVKFGGNGKPVVNWNDIKSASAKSEAVEGFWPEKDVDGDDDGDDDEVEDEDDN